MGLGVVTIPTIIEAMVVMLEEIEEVFGNDWRDGDQCGNPSPAIPSWLTTKLIHFFMQ